MTKGKQNKAIGQDLGVSPRTIEIHRARVMEKMSAHSVAELVRMMLDLNHAAPADGDQAWPPPAWPRTARMEGGVEYHIRPIRRDDAERERAFIMSLSPESRFQRLMYTLREPSAEFVARLVNVDEHRDMALVATLGEGAAEKIIGVARYAADEDGRDCEFAVAVADEWQCRGIGTTLTKILFECRRTKASARFTAPCSRTTSACSNCAMAGPHGRAAGHGPGYRTRIAPPELTAGSESGSLRARGFRPCVPTDARQVIRNGAHLLEVERLDALRMQSR